MDVRLCEYVPLSGTVARRLWRDGVGPRSALEHALRWGADVELAWQECDRLELVLPLALLRGAPIAAVAGVARTWVRDAFALLGELDCPPYDRDLADRCLDEACAPDVDAQRLEELMASALERGDPRAPGHRYILMTACGAVAELGRRRVGLGYFASAPASRCAHALVHVLDEVSEPRDLFSKRVDGAGFIRGAIALAHRELEPAELAAE